MDLVLQEPSRKIIATSENSVPGSCVREVKIHNHKAAFPGGGLQLNVPFARDYNRKNSSKGLLRLVGSTQDRLEKCLVGSLHLPWCFFACSSLGFSVCDLFWCFWNRGVPPQNTSVSPVHAGRQVATKTHKNASKRPTHSNASFISHGPSLVLKSLWQAVVSKIVIKVWLLSLPEMAQPTQ